MNIRHLAIATPLILGLAGGMPARADDATAAPPPAAPVAEAQPGPANAEAPPVAAQGPAATPATASAAADATTAAAPKAGDAAAAEADTATAAAKAEAARRAAEAQRYLDAVDEIHANSGAYDPGLAQNLFSLGRSYREAGQYDQAVTILSRAAHITRVNEGLYSPGGIPILQQLIETHASMGQWEAVSTSYQRIFQIEHHAYGDNDERLLPTLQQLSRWHMRAYVNGLGEDPLNHLLTVRNLNESSLRIVETRYGPLDERMGQELRRSALVNYYLASYDYGQQAEAVSVGVSRDMMGPTMPNYAVAGYSNGRRALERAYQIASSNPKATALEKSLALAELGDWNQLFNRRQTALEIYMQAYATAAGAGAQGNEYAQIVFGRPVELPILPRDVTEPLAPAGGPAGAASAPVPTLTAHFGVDASGQPRDIDIAQSSPPASNSDLSDIRDRIRTSRFRPRFENGQPVDTPGLVYQISYTP